jgi:hypothetical protein
MNNIAPDDRDAKQTQMSAWRANSDTSGQRAPRGTQSFHSLARNRRQAALLPAAIEDYVAADAPIRVIDAFMVWPNSTGSGRTAAVHSTLTFCAT